eukprot:361716-Chlamydomonas_euryale.AAC.7
MLPQTSSSPCGAVEKLTVLKGEAAHQSIACAALLKMSRSLALPHAQVKEKTHDMGFGRTSGSLRGPRPAAAEGPSGDVRAAVLRTGTSMWRNAPAPVLPLDVRGGGGCGCSAPADEKSWAPTQAYAAPASAQPGSSSGGDDPQRPPGGNSTRCVGGAGVCAPGMQPLPLSDGDSATDPRRLGVDGIAPPALRPFPPPPPPPLAPPPPLNGRPPACALPPLCCR